MRRRLVRVAAATTIMVTLAFVVPLALLVRTLAAERALTSAQQVAGALAPAIADGEVDRILLALSIAQAEAPGRVTVVLPDGRRLGDVAVSDDEVAEARDGTAFSREVAGARDVVTPVLGVDGTSVVHVRVPTAVLTAGVWQAWAVLGGLGVVLVLAAVIVADRLGRSVVQPADDVASAARRLAGGDRDARAPVAGPPEIADVAAALNGLADRLDDLLAAEREAAADLSHRLRTPLTALRLDVEALPADRTTDRLLADVRATEEAVDQLIRAARTGGTARGWCDVGAVVADRVAFWAPLLEDEDRALKVDLPEDPVPAAVDASDLAAAIDALLGNVLHHTDVGTGLAVRVTHDDRSAGLAVEDAGPGFADLDVTRRGVSGAASTGLGLDICRRLAEGVGGSLAIDRGPLGGARVRLELPRQLERPSP